MRLVIANHYGQALILKKERNHFTSVTGDYFFKLLLNPGDVKTTPSFRLRWVN